MCQRETIAPSLPTDGDCIYWHFPASIVVEHQNVVPMLDEAIRRMNEAYTEFARANITSYADTVADVAHLGIQAIGIVKEIRAALTCRAAEPSFEP
jgi:hypothetical protein